MNKSEKKSIKKNLKKKQSILYVTPQRAICYAETLCSKSIDRLKKGKENQFRNMNMGQVQAGGARLVVGTNGYLKAGHVSLPTGVMEKLGDKSTGSYIFIRYPVLTEGNIAFGKAYASGKKRATADVPSSQYKYNGGDNDGDAFNFIRLKKGLIANAAYDAECLMAPWHNLHNNGELKVEFDSDAKMGLGKRWMNIMNDLRTELFAYNNSSVVFEKFCNYERIGRDQSSFVGCFKLEDYSHNTPAGVIAKIIDTSSVARFSESHYFQSVYSLGPPRYAFNKEPVLDYIKSNYVNGLLPIEYIATCQSTVDTLAEQKSSIMSTQGNVQYQLQYTSRPMVLSPNLTTVFNDITNKIIHINVSSLFLSSKPNADERVILESDLDFARMCVGLKPIFEREDYLQKLLECEVKQYLNISHLITVEE